MCFTPSECAADLDCAPNLHSDNNVCIELGNPIIQSKLYAVNLLGSRTVDEVCSKDTHCEDPLLCVMEWDGHRSLCE